MSEPLITIVLIYKCPKCGYHLTKFTKECPECGEKLEWSNLFKPNYKEDYKD